MNHLTNEQLTDAYYGELSSELRQHVSDCPECRASFERVRDVLDSVRDYPVPERGPSYGSVVWTRLLPHLAERKPPRFWLQWWTIAPVAAGLLALVFFAGMLTQKQRELGIPADARERVLLIALSDHLERSQIVLAQLVNGEPGTLDLADERERARDLITENRLLRQSTLHSGDVADAALLDELERVLLDIANGSSTPDEITGLQHEIENQGLLFKVRITSVDARHKGQRL